MAQLRRNNLFFSFSFSFSVSHSPKSGLFDLENIIKKGRVSP